jgi:hypothetical protein
MTDQTTMTSREREADESDGLVAVQTAIRTANQQLLDKTAANFELPIAVLIEQRDEALQQSEALRQHARGERTALIAEQDQFITFLMTDHETKLVKLSEELKSTKEALARQRALEGPVADSPGTSMGDITDSGMEIARLKDLLEAAYAEADETRADAARLQAELDDAVRAADDVRLELRLEVDAARDDAFRIQSQLDETNRLLEDARDQARDDAFRFTEELDEARRTLDDRVAEVRRLRERLSQLDAAPRNSLPPPPAPGGAELNAARADNQLLRKQLIEAKRDLSRVTRELELASARRISRPTPYPGARPTPNPSR